MFWRCTPAKRNRFALTAMMFPRGSATGSEAAGITPNIICVFQTKYKYSGSKSPEGAHHQRTEEHAEECQHQHLAEDLAEHVGVRVEELRQDQQCQRGKTAASQRKRPDRASSWTRVCPRSCLDLMDANPTPRGCHKRYVPSSCRLRT